MNVIKSGDYVVLIDRKGKKWLVKVEDNKMFQIHHGKLDLNDLIGKRYGSIVNTHLGRNLYAKKPTIHDFIMKSKRKTQIIYPKDIGYIILKLGLRPGMNILEVGTGSGAMTSSLIWILGREGTIDTYEKRRDIADIAIRNILRIHHGKSIIKLHVEDIRDADLPMEKYDAAIIDMDSPWEIIDKVYHSLKPGGGVAFIIPTYNQLEKLLPTLENLFSEIDAVEIFIRRLQAKQGKIRPEFRMIGYTNIVLTCFKSQ